MARNRNPEQTLEQILTISARLFIENGYEKTSIQDIIAALGMSKGAIYHHFKSKEEILGAVMEKQFRYAAQLLNRLLTETEASNARQKLMIVLENLVDDPAAHTLDKVLSNHMKNPQFVLNGMKISVQKDAPLLAQLMLEGKEDGSITTDFPYECAEVLLLLLNIWINPVLFDRKPAETLSRLHFLQQLLKGLGADIVSERFIQLVAAHHVSIGSYGEE